MIKYGQDLENTSLKIAIIMAAYNGMEWIAEQIESILKQRNVTIHLYISIDSSNDNTQKWCEKLAEQKNNITVLPTTKKFGGAAPNFFRLLTDIDFTPYHYIAYSDQDDIWYPDKLSRAVKKLKQTNSSAYSSNVTAFWKNGTEQLIDKAQSQQKWDFLFESAGPGCTFVMTQKLAQALQQFILKHSNKMKKIWFHDWFTYAYARSHGYQWFIDKQPSLHYRQHESNQVGINKGYKAFRHRMQLVISGAALKQASLLVTLFQLEQNPFIKKWYKLNRVSIIVLMLNARKCRRKTSDQVFFVLSCLILSIIGNR
jgi:rhamnosyltransferase